MSGPASNDFPRPAPRFTRVARGIRCAIAAIVVLAAGRTLGEVSPWSVEPWLPAICAAVAVDDPCGDGVLAARQDDASPSATMSVTVQNGTDPTTPPQTGAPRWSGDALNLPLDYRQWVLAGSSLGLGYSEAASGHDAFHAVFLERRAYAQFRDTRTFPEGTMLALEIRDVAARVPPARHGSFAGQRLAVEIAVKDTKRFAEGWAYFDFGDGRPTARPQPPSRCESCHRAHAETDHVFTQFYSGIK